MSTWTLQRKDTDEVIELPQDMQWIDEFDWCEIASGAPKYSITGAMIVQKSRKKAGAPITIGGEWVWLQRGDYEQLQEWAKEATLKMTLTHYDGSKFNVSFRHHDKPINAKPVSYETPEADDAPYIGSINLMTI